MKISNLLFILIICVGGILISSTSCEKTSHQDPPDRDDSSNLEQSVSLSMDSILAEVGDTVVITPTFGTGVSPEREYSWEVDSNGVIEELSVGKDYSLKILVKKAGTTKIIIRSKDKALEDSCIIKSYVADDGIIRVLALGNSFSEDVLEHYFHGLADAAGIKLIIGHLFIGGSSLSMHWTNALQDKKAYEFREIGIDGNKTSTPNKSIAEVVSSAPWDYISMQQVSYLTGLFNTYKEPFPKLYDYIKSRAIKSSVKMVFHQIWAYQQGSSHSEFDNYNNDQMTMYNAIVDAVWKADGLRDIDIIVPSGTAIQDGRATRLGDNFTRDSYHLNSLGQYTASCTWFEAIFGKNVIGNTFAPNELTSEQIEIAQHVAHAAVQHPKEVTVLEEYLPVTPEGEGIQDDPVYIGFGSTNIGNHPGWNALSGSSKGNKINNLIDYSMVNTGVSIEITESFNGTNSGGASGVNLFGISIPNDISKNSYFGNSKKAFNGKSAVESELKVSGLDTSQTYDFCFFASRSGVSDNRETKYTVIGQNSAIDTLNASNNTSKGKCIDGIQPDNNGEVTIKITSGANNSNSYGFFYVSFIRISKSN